MSWYLANIDYNIHMYTFMMYMSIHSCLSFERSTPVRTPLLRAAGIDDAQIAQAAGHRRQVL